jgi:hypothetical protein
MSAGPLGSSKGVCQRAVQEALLSHLCALADAGLSSAALACDCLAHRFGNVADRGVRERRYPPDGHVGCRVGGARARRSHYKRRGHPPAVAVMGRRRIRQAVSGSTAQLWQAARLQESGPSPNATHLGFWAGRLRCRVLEGPAMVTAVWGGLLCW